MELAWEGKRTRKIQENRKRETNIYRHGGGMREMTNTFIHTSALGAVMLPGHVKVTNS